MNTKKNMLLSRDEAFSFRAPKGKCLNVVVNWADGDWKTHENIFGVAGFDDYKLFGCFYMDVIKNDGKCKSFEWLSIINVEYYLSDAENELGTFVGVWNRQ